MYIFRRRSKGIANAKEDFGSQKHNKFVALSIEIENQLQTQIESVIVRIAEGLIPKVEAFVVPKLQGDVIPSLIQDADIFVNNYGGISISQLNAIRESRGGVQQICATRKYMKSAEEFKKYIQACISGTVLPASNPAYDVLIKAVVSKEEGVLYLSTFFPGMG